MSKAKMETEEEEMTEIESVKVEELNRKEKYQQIPDLNEEEYNSLKSDIEEKGVTDAIHIDEENNVLDGNHRVQICGELDIDEIRANRHTDLTEEEKVDWQFDANSNRRNMGEGRKRDLIETRFLVLDERDEHKTDSAIAENLGVGETTVRNVRHDLTGKNRIGAEFATKEDKREQAEEYFQENPEASNREVASETPVSRTTAGKIKKELEEPSQSDSKASDTGTQTEEGSDEDESYNDDSDSEEAEGVSNELQEESTATTTSTSESGVSDETETDSTGDDDGGSRTGPFGKPLKDESDGNDDSEPEKVTAVRESTGEKVGVGEKDETVGSIEEITPPDEPSESDLENIKSKTENLIGDLPDDIEDNLKERSKELLDLWEAHINMASYSHNLRCPVCGDDSLEYTCHHIKPDEALSLANQAYDNHLKGKEELEGTEYEDVATEERGFDGKEKAPSFEEALKN